MQKIREFLSKPAIGWSVAGVAIVIAMISLYRFGYGIEGPYDPRRLQQDVVIRYTDTEEEITMPRGRFEALLRERGQSVNPNEGLTNPKTGKPTGFLVAKDEWEEACLRIKNENAAAKSLSPWGK